jgi:hypothetical protein
MTQIVEAQASYELLTMLSRAANKSARRGSIDLRKVTLRLRQTYKDVSSQNLCERSRTRAPLWAAHPMYKPAITESFR